MRGRNFFIAEILACVTYVLNSICVITATQGGAGSSAWDTHFGVIYWSKSILAIIGLYFFFSSRVFVTKETPRYRSVMALLLLFYSIPVANLLLATVSLGFFKLVKGGAFFQYEDRIPLVIIWLLPASIIAVDIVTKLLKTGEKTKA